MRFIHLADIHLGCRRYNLEERTKDFFRSWYDCITNHVVPNQVDFLLVSGDFFNSRKVDPQTMNHAMAGLERLRAAQIPVLVIEGNHDQRDVTSDFSWLRSLSQWGYLRLLEPVKSSVGRLSLLPWNEEERSGSYVDIAGARVFGSNWYGTSANAAIPLLVDMLRDSHDPRLFNILMLHTDVEGQLNRPIPALSIAKLKELKQYVDYVALGHTHKRFEIENWAFNPGSLEAVSIDEYSQERGFYLVEVDQQKNISSRHLRDYIQRPFQRISFDVSGIEDPETLSQRLLEKIGVERRFDEESPSPIVEITLKGYLGFKNSLLDTRRLREEAAKITGALHVLFKNQSVPVEYAAAAGTSLDTPRHERERIIIEDLIMRDNRYKHMAKEMAALVIEAKRMTLENESPERLVELVKKLQQREDRPAAVNVNA
jgi:DNA repair protein SbcD/Mre11